MLVKEMRRVLAVAQFILCALIITIIAIFTFVTTNILIGVP